MTYTADEYRKTFSALTVRRLRSRAAEAGIRHRSTMNKAQLVECLAAKQIVEDDHAEALEIEAERSTDIARDLQVAEDLGLITSAALIEDAHAEALELDEKRSVVRASLSVQPGEEISWTGVEQAYDAYVIGRDAYVIGRDALAKCDHGVEPHMFCQSCSDERPAYAAQVDRVKAMRERVLSQS